MRRLLRDHGLSICMFGLFFVFVCGQSVMGLLDYNSTQQEHGRPPVGYVHYLGSGDFIEAVFENWESEFLQMGLYVLLTAFLYQRGSAESRDPDSRQGRMRLFLKRRASPSGCTAPRGNFRPLKMPKCL
jgi:hypothetical protein